ncbi:hypothetical protein [Aurantimonas sp. A2-1-M11]
MSSYNVADIQRISVETGQQRRNLALAADCCRIGIPAVSMSASVAASASR